MAFNVAGSVEVPLSQFSGLVTEMAAPDLPEGASPDNQDVTFLPGSVRGRPGLKRVFATPFPATPTVTYAKSYVDPTGVIRNLYLDSNGVIYVENLSTSPGTYTVIGQTTPGSYAKSITAFGREYIAVSDGLHGQEVPLQYDGVTLDRVTQDGPGTPPVIASVVIPASDITSLTRAINIVTAVTASPHGLKQGYIAKVSNVPAAAVGTAITSIVINNEDSPGLATVTTSSPHGLVPGVFATISGVTAPTVATIANAIRHGQAVTLITTAPHGISVGAAITVNATDTTFNGSFIVAQVNAPTEVAYTQAESTNQGGAAGGSIRLNWPTPALGISANLEVVSAPTPTTFEVAINYSDGTWTTGIVSYAWNGSFFVLAGAGSTFTYQQYGPAAASGAVGTITPQGQAAPGQHQLQVLFQTRQGAITRPSPPVKFIANGGQYLSVSNIPIGPPNIVARILAFTGAQGAFFFYIPVPAQVNGQVVSTATQINDNTTTSIVLDFSDNTLFAALGIGIPGNNLANQIVLDSALGFGFYGSRLLAYGQRNKIQNLLNMDFYGGFLPSAPTLPTGWGGGGAGGALVPNSYGGQDWLISTPGTLTQSFYQDAYGAPIALPNTAYFIRVFLRGGGSFIVTMSSVLTGFSASAVIPAAAAGGAWFEAAFSAKTPTTIPIDFLLTISGVSVQVAELSIIYTQTPFTDTIINGSYVDNPEGFDGVSGKFGPSDDVRKIMDFGIIRRNLYLVTLDPTGRIHVTADNGTTEPAGWTIDEVAANCGLLSAFALTRSQADDASAGGGEEWFAWASLSGARLFSGSDPWKISQEIQPDWDNIHLASQLTIWALNDPVMRRMYFGLPVCPASAPNLIYVLDYRGLETAYDIAMASPVRVGVGGKLIATDKARKWTRWNMTMNGAALMYRPAPVCS